MPRKPQPVRLPASQELLRHIDDVQRINRRYDVILVDFWSPGVADVITDPRSIPGGVEGQLDEYLVRYTAGRDLAVDLEILEADSGRRIAQDGSPDHTVLDALLARLAGGQDIR